MENYIEKYMNELRNIEEKHQAFFKDKTENKNKIENYIVIDNLTGKLRLAFRNESELTEEIKQEVIDLWNSIFNKK